MRDTTGRGTRIGAGLRALSILPTVSAALLLLAACGRGVPAAPAATSSDPTATGALGSGAGPNTPGAGSATPGRAAVTLSSSDGAYANGRPITITIQNHLGTPIYAIDTHTSCTVIQLQHWDGTTWRSVGGCGGQVPHPSVLTITDEAAVTIEPSQGLNLGGPWPAGTYRAELTYATSAGASLASGTSVYSTSFAIG